MPGVLMCSRICRALSAIKIGLSGEASIRRTYAPPMMGSFEYSGFIVRSAENMAFTLPGSRACSVRRSGLAESIPWKSRFFVAMSQIFWAAMPAPATAVVATAVAAALVVALPRCPAKRLAASPTAPKLGMLNAVLANISPISATSLMFKSSYCRGRTVVVRMRPTAGSSKSWSGTQPHEHLDRDKPATPQAQRHSAGSAS